MHSILPVLMGAICFSTIIQSLTIDIQSQITIQVPDNHPIHRQYPLRYIEAAGNVNFEIKGAPQGVNINGSTLQVDVTIDTVIKSPYPLLISATDQSGETDQIIIVLIIKKVPFQPQNPPQEDSPSNDNQNPKNQQSQNNLQQQNPKLDNILSELNISDQPQNVYEIPTNNLPFSSPHPLPPYAKFELQNIETKQSQIPNRIKIPQTQIRQREMINKQIRTSQALSNLLDILRRARSQRGRLQQQLSQKQEQLQKIQEKVDKKSAQLNKQQIQYQRIREGLKKTNQEIQMLRNTIKDYGIEQRKSELEKTVIERAMDSVRRYINENRQQIKSNQQLLSKLSRQFQKKYIQMTEVQAQINQIQKEIEKRPKLKLKLENQKTQVVAGIGKTKGEIDELRAKLVKAEAELGTLEGNLQNINIELYKFQEMDRLLEEKSKQLQQKYQIYEKQSNELKVALQELASQTIPSLEQRQFLLQRQLQSLSEKLQEISTKLESIPSELRATQYKLQELQLKYSYLSGQSIKHQQYLRKQYLKDNDLNRILNQTNSDVEQLRAQLQQQKQIIEQALENIELAKLEKDKANRQLSDYVEHSSKMHNLKAADNANSLNKQQSESNFQIESWPSFIENNFGSGIEPLSSNKINTLYPYNLIPETKDSVSNLRSSQKNNQQESQPCSNQNLISLSGYIISIDSSANIINFIDHHLSSNTYSIQIQKCTVMVSNMEKYQPKPGDVIIVKGQLNDTTINAVEIASVSNE